jgi:hypothetical protein
VRQTGRLCKVNRNTIARWVPQSSRFKLIDDQRRGGTTKIILESGHHDRPSMRTGVSLPSRSSPSSAVRPQPFIGMSSDEPEVSMSGTSRLARESVP